MPHQQKSLASLLNVERIRELARPSNIRYGEAIYRRGGIGIITYSPYRIEAWVGGLDGKVVEGGSQRRRTVLRATGTGLHWHCTESAKEQQIFCKHCVTLALAIIDKKLH